MIKPFFQARTKIVATLGPASSSPEMIRKLILNGLDVARINMAHGTFSEHAHRIKMIRDSAHALGASVGILMDLPGPKLRVAQLPSAGLELQRNDEVFLTSDKSKKGPKVIALSYKHLNKDLKKGEAVFICDGLIRLVVDSHRQGEVRCRVTHGGTVHVGNGVNLPHSDLSIEAFTPEDKKLLDFGLKQNIDFVGISFVGDAEDIRRVRQFSQARNKSPFIIAKIERREALNHLDEIIEETDGIMVARGDLGVEIPFYELPQRQEDIVSRSREKGKPVIVATQVLESMIHNPRPTRAEATDVANAVMQGADAVMLSGETAVGKYPAEAVKSLSELLSHSEKEKPSNRFNAELLKDSKLIMTYEACNIATQMKAKFILVQSITGRSGLRTSRFRPFVPIIALVADEKAQRILSLVWGVQSYVVGKRALLKPNVSMPRIIKKLIPLQKGDRAILIDTPIYSSKIMLSVIDA
ncbi:MAG: pyruvate kinase [Elusimicrobiota bacterium]